MSAKRAYRGTWKARHRHNDRTRVAIRYRAYPTDGQRQRIAYICGACRFVQNLAKEQRVSCKALQPPSTFLQLAVGRLEGAEERARPDPLARRGADADPPTGA